MQQAGLNKGQLNKAVRVIALRSRAGIKPYFFACLLPLKVKIVVVMQKIGLGNPYVYAANQFRSMIGLNDFNSW